MCNKIVAGTFILFLFLQDLFPAFDFKINSPRVGAMGGAYTGLANDCAALFVNPAGLRLMPRFASEFFYTKIYGLDDLAYNQFSVILPTEKLGTFGLGYSSFGGSQYSESELVLGQSFYLGEGLLFGYKVKNMSLAISGYGSQSVFGFDAGFLIKVSPEISIGAVGKNVNAPSIGENMPEHLPQGINLGMAIRPTKGLIFTLDGEKNVDYPVNMKLGIDFQLLKNFSVRTGLMSYPSRYSFGFGLNFSVFRLDYAFVNHPVLSEEHQLAITLNFGRETEKVYEWREQKGKGSRAKKGEQETEPVSEKKAPAKKVNINDASVDALQELPGLGKVTAERIVEYRKSVGKFIIIDELMKVPRMTKRTFAKIEPYITTGEEPVPAPAEAPAPKQESPAPVPSPLVPKQESIEKKAESREPEKPAPTPVIPATTEESKDEKSEPAKPVPVPEVVPAPKKEIPASKPGWTINTIDLDTLIDEGVHPIVAENIIIYRQKNKGFKSFEELKSVSGMDEGTYKEMQRIFGK